MVEVDGGGRAREGYDVACQLIDSAVQAWLKLEAEVERATCWVRLKA
jgi:hypothetical protein